MYLADANLLSEPTKRVCHEGALSWLEANESDLAASSVVMGELWRGVDALCEGRKKQELIAWYTKLRSRIVVLDWTLETATVWATMVNYVKRSGYTVGLFDTMIAATAKQHGLTVATRNVKDFTCCGVTVVNPFE